MNVAGHYELWELGYEHTDPSLSNLMMDSQGRGILNDWDLCHVRHSVPDQKHHQERTGTIPFMVLDLLTQRYWNGQIQRLYRHDLEAFIWILPWVFLQYDGQKLSDKPEFARWNSGDYNSVRACKRDYLHNALFEIPPMECWKEEWQFAQFLLSWLRDNEFARVNSGNPFIEQDGPPKDVTYDDFQRTVKEAEKFYPPFCSMRSIFSKEL